MATEWMLGVVVVVVIWWGYSSFQMEEVDAGWAPHLNPPALDAPSTRFFISCGKTN